MVAQLMVVWQCGELWTLEKCDRNPPIELVQEFIS